jgi:hypothetical protein
LLNLLFFECPVRPVARCDESGEAGGDLLLSWVAPAIPFRERAGDSVDRLSRLASPAAVARLATALQVYLGD